MISRTTDLSGQRCAAKYRTIRPVTPQPGFPRSGLHNIPWVPYFLAFVLLWGSAGCVERRLLIRSNPPGAMVYVDDYQVGATPIGTSFTYYGTRKIRLVKDGYQTLTVYEKISPPWYQIPPFDFFAENLLRREVRDTRVLTYQLVPQPVAPTQQLLDRAESLRAQAAAEPPLPAARQSAGAFPQNPQFDRTTPTPFSTEIPPSATHIPSGGGP